MIKMPNAGFKPEWDLPTKPDLNGIISLIDSSLKQIDRSAEYEDYGKGSLRYALVAYLEEELKQRVIPDWLKQFDV